MAIRPGFVIAGAGSFCELIAPQLEHGKSDLFLLGMLWLIDAILAMPIGVVIEEWCQHPAIKEQLLAAKTGKKTPLSPIYDLMLAREAGDWGWSRPWETN
jgi:c-di-GMP-related signal transduction protein